MAVADQQEQTPFDAYMARRQVKEQQLVSRLDATLAVLEARCPQVLRYRTGAVSASEVLQRVARLAHIPQVPCDGCTPYVEALLWLERQYVTLFQEQDERLQRLEAGFAGSEQRDLDYASLQEAYDALVDAHDALQQAYQDLRERV